MTFPFKAVPLLLYTDGVMLTGHDESKVPRTVDILISKLLPKGGKGNSGPCTSEKLLGLCGVGHVKIPSKVNGKLL